MPLLRPLRALHYGRDLWDIADHLVSPSRGGEPQDRSQLGEGHPLRIRQLVRGARGPLASDSEAPYTHAARLLQRWQEEGVIVRDPRPAFYALELDDGARLRRGILALVRLGEGPWGRLLPHERVEEGSTGDLIDQLEATRTWFSVPMGLVPDMGGHLAHAAQDVDRADLVVTDGRDVRTRAWRIEDPAVHRRIQEVLREEDAVIADGHHRVLAARELRRRATVPVQREHPLDYVPMLLLPASGSDADSGPLHRTATVPPAPSSALLARLAVAAASLPDLPAAGAFLRDHPASAVVVATPGVLLGLQLPGDGALVERVQADLVLPLEREGVRFDPGLHDRLSPRAAAASAFSGAHPLALAFAGPSGAEILSRARAGLPFPPKSTKFAPKPPKGFLLTSTRSF